MSFSEILKSVRCWDQAMENSYKARGWPAADAVLQNRTELEQLCQWIEKKRIRSYLEIGIWTGATLRLLHQIFKFEKLACCDTRAAEKCGLRISVPVETQTFWGRSQGNGYLAWRRKVGQFDLVLIDGDHSYLAVRRDFMSERQLPHRFLAFHDISNPLPKVRGVGNVWREITSGSKLEIVCPQSESDAATMGIGIWSEKEIP